VHNELLDCSKFTFFDQVDKLDFDFLLLNTNEFIEVQPEISFNQTQTGNIMLKLPASEQTKMPVFTDIQLLVTIRWKNANFQPEFNELVFQNIKITLRFEPSDT